MVKNSLSLGPLVLLIFRASGTNIILPLAVSMADWTGVQTQRVIVHSSLQEDKSALSLLQEDKSALSLLQEDNVRVIKICIVVNSVRDSAKCRTLIVDFITDLAMQYQIKTQYLSISYCPHTRAITDINDRGKVGCPSYGRGRSPRLYEGNRLSRGH